MIFPQQERVVSQIDTTKEPKRYVINHGVTWTEEQT